MTSEQQPTARVVKIKSCNGMVVEVPEAVATQSTVIKCIVENVGADLPIPIPNVTDNILTKVFEFCTKHVELCSKQAAAKEEMENWGQQFTNVSVNTLSDIIKAAHYLNIEELMDLCCEKMARMTAEKSPEEIRRIFNIQNDFTPEEEEAIQRENSWAFDDDSGRYNNYMF